MFVVKAIAPALILASIEHSSYAFTILQNVSTQSPWAHQEGRSLYFAQVATRGKGRAMKKGAAVLVQRLLVFLGWIQSYKKTEEHDFPTKKRKTRGALLRVL